MTILGINKSVLWVKLYSFWRVWNKLLKLKITACKEFSIVVSVALKLGWLLFPTYHTFLILSMFPSKYNSIIFCSLRSLQWVRKARLGLMLQYSRFSILLSYLWEMDIMCYNSGVERIFILTFCKWKWSYQLQIVNKLNGHCLIKTFYVAYMLTVTFPQTHSHQPPSLQTLKLHPSGSSGQSNMLFWTSGHKVEPACSNSRLNQSAASSNSNTSCSWLLAFLPHTFCLYCP